MNTTENNKLIAEFMGLKKYGYKNENYLVLSKHLSPEQLPYQTSWDWILPVVQRCFEVHEQTNDDLCFNISKLYRCFLNDALLETNINSLYKAVVEFINEYNNQNN